MRIFVQSECLASDSGSDLEDAESELGTRRCVGFSPYDDTESDADDSPTSTSRSHTKPFRALLVAEAALQIKDLSLKNNLVVRKLVAPGIRRC